MVDWSDARRAGPSVAVEPVEAVDGVPRAPDEGPVGFPSCVPVPVAAADSRIRARRSSAWATPLWSADSWFSAASAGVSAAVHACALAGPARAGGAFAPDTPAPAVPDPPVRDAVPVAPAPVVPVCVGPGVPPPPVPDGDDAHADRARPRAAAAVLACASSVACVRTTPSCAAASDEPVPLDEADPVPAVVDPDAPVV